MAKRRSNQLSARDTLYIITNGEQTEVNYFNLLKEKRSLYKVKVIFKNADPYRLVEYAREIDKDANQVWCVFDIDNAHNESRLVPAIKQAEKYGIKYAYSNIAFEVWLLSHFVKCSNELDVSQLNKNLDKQLNTIDKNLKYIKTDKELLYKHFIPRYKQAIENSKIIYQNRVKEHIENFGENSRYRIWEWNSSTNVFQLIEALKLQK